jgi:hypothetical protein
VVPTKYYSPPSALKDEVDEPNRTMDGSIGTAAGADPVKDMDLHMYTQYFFAKKSKLVGMYTLEMRSDPITNR